MPISVDAIATPDVDLETRRRWDGLDSTSICGALCSSPAYCDVVAIDDGVAQTALVAREGTRVVGVVLADLMPEFVPPHYRVDALLRDGFVADGLPSWEPPRTLVPGMVATTRAGYACDFRLDGGLAAEARREALSALVAALGREGAAKGALSTSALFVPCDDRDVVAALESAGFARARIDAQPYVPVEFADFDGYVRTLAKRRRDKVKYERGLLARERSALTRLRPLAEGLEEHVAIVGRTFVKYTGSFDHVQYARRMQLFVDAFGADARVVELVVRGTVLGSLLTIRYRDSLTFRGIGSAPEIPRRLAPYYNLLYAAVDLACREELATVVFGTQLVPDKLRIGCALEHHDLWLQTDEPALVERLRVVDAATKRVLDEWEAIRARSLASHPLRSDRLAT